MFLFEGLYHIVGLSTTFSHIFNSIFNKYLLEASGKISHKVTKISYQKDKNDHTRFSSLHLTHYSKFALTRLTRFAVRF